MAMKVIDLDHNSVGLILYNLHSFTDVENYAIATHNRELFEENLRNHNIEIVNDKHHGYVIQVFEDKNLNALGDINRYIFEYSKTITNSNNVYLFPNLIITSEDIVFDSVCIQKYFNIHNKKYIVYCTENFEVLLFVCYYKQVDIFKFKHNHGNSLNISSTNSLGSSKIIQLNTFHDYQIQKKTYQFKNFIKSIDIDQQIIEIENDGKYLFYVSYDNFGSESPFNINNSSIHLAEQVYENNNLRIFVRNRKICKILTRNHYCEKCAINEFPYFRDNMEYFYSKLTRIYSSKKDYNLLEKLYNFCVQNINKLHLLKLLFDQMLSEYDRS